MNLVESWKLLARTKLQRGRATSGRIGIELRISFGFALLSALCGLRSGAFGPMLTLFVLSSVLLVQELPRALIVRRSGGWARIVFSAGGGRTEFRGTAPTGLARIAFYASGSAANVAVAVACAGLLHAGVLKSLAPLLARLGLSHAVWGAAQALPFVPFRVGQAIAAVSPPATRSAHVALSATFVLTLTVMCLARSAPDALFPLAALGLSGALSAVSQTLLEASEARSGITALALEARQRLLDGDALVAAELAGRALAGARSRGLRVRLWETLTWAGIGQHDALLAHRALAHLPADTIDVYLIAAYLSCCNRIDEAIELLREAREFGQSDRESTKLLIDLLFRRGDSGAALELARSDERLLSVDDRRAIGGALRRGAIQADG